MNNGFLEISYGAPLEAKRVRYKVHQGSSQAIGEALVLKSTDNISALSPKYKGNTTSTVERCDLVLPVPMSTTNTNSTVYAGSIMLQLPDGGVTGGSARGQGSIDFQTSRTANYQVSSGRFATTMGADNRASYNSAVALGYNNSAGSGVQSYIAIAIGATNVATFAGSVAIGSSNTSSTVGASTIGVSNTTSGNYGIALGRACTANGAMSLCTGYGAGAGSVVGKRSHGYTCYTGELSLTATTLDATPKILTSDNNTPGSSNQIYPGFNGAYSFDGLVVARQQASQGTAAAAWKISGLLRKQSANSSITLIDPVVTTISNIPGWTFAMDTDVTMGTLKLVFTGAIATNIICSATIRSAETGYA